MNLQSWFTETRCLSRLLPEQILRIDPVLPRWIALDDAKESLRVLPALAESEFERVRERLSEFLELRREGRTQGVGTERALSADYQGVIREYRAETQGLRDVLEKVTAKPSHHTVARYVRYYIGETSDDDWCEVEVLVSAHLGETITWFTEGFGVTQALAKVPPSLKETLVVRTDPGYELDVVELADRGGNALLALLPRPELVGPGRMKYTYKFSWPGMWDPLRYEGRDYCYYQVPEGVTTTVVETHLVFPSRATNVTVQSSIGDVVQSLTDRPIVSWKMESPPAGRHVLTLAIDPLT